MEQIIPIFQGIAWPLALAIAWAAGEAGYRWLGLPRISSYGIAGFAMSASQGGFLGNPPEGAVILLADFAFALILFELGYRINLRWLRTNPWIGISAAAEAFSTFAAVFAIGRLFDLNQLTALLLAALAMSTSPAAILRVINETRSAGQVTERLLHLSALNCIFAVMVFKATLAYWALSSDKGIFDALWSSAAVLIVSVALGATFGVAVPGILRWANSPHRNSTVALALAILLLTALTHFLKFSPLVAALVFGLAARHRRICFSQAQQNFGSLGDLLTVLLFVFTTSLLDWRQMTSGIGLALTIVLVRLLTKTAATTAFARISGTTWRKGALTGLALTPFSVFAMFLIEQSRHLKLPALAEISGVALMILLIEIIGPVITQRALTWAGETQKAN